MENLDSIQRVVTWKSTKTPNGTFTATAYSFDYQVKPVIHAEYNRKTRAQAVSAVKKAVKWIKAQ